MCYRMLQILHVVEYILYTIVSIKPPSCALRYGFTCIAGLLSSIQIRSSLSLNTCCVMQYDIKFHNYQDQDTSEFRVPPEDCYHYITSSLGYLCHIHHMLTT